MDMASWTLGAGIMKPRWVNPHARMENRAMDKLWREGEGSSLAEGPWREALACALFKAHKGNPTLFKQGCRPSVQALSSELAHADFNRVARRIDPDGALGDMGQQGALWNAHECWSGFSDLDYPSLHDAKLRAWNCSDAQLWVEFDGWFANGRKTADMNQLAFLFESPQVSALCAPMSRKASELVKGSGRPACLVRGVARGFWGIDESSSAPMIASKTQRMEWGISELGPIDCSEVSKKTESTCALRWRHSFVHGWRVELSVEFTQLRMFWGAAAIRSFKSSMEQKALLSDAIAPVSMASRESLRV